MPKVSKNKSSDRAHKVRQILRELTDSELIAMTRECRVELARRNTKLAAAAALFAQKPQEDDND